MGAVVVLALLAAAVAFFVVRRSRRRRIADLVCARSQCSVHACVGVITPAGDKSALYVSVHLAELGCLPI